MWSSALSEGPGAGSGIAEPADRAERREQTNNNRGDHCHSETSPRPAPVLMDARLELMDELTAGLGTISPELGL